MREFIAKTKVVLTAAPTYGAAVVAVLTVISTSVVPVLPVAVGVKVAAWVAAALGAVQAVVSVISRVTPILFPDEKGLLPVEPRPVSDEALWDEFWRSEGDAA